MQPATKSVRVPEALFEYWKPEDEVSKKLTELSVLELLRERRITASRGKHLDLRISVPGNFGNGRGGVIEPGTISTGATMASFCWFG